MTIKRVLLAFSVVLALLVLGVSPALAQDGDGGKVVIGQNYVLAAGNQLHGDLAVLGGSAVIEDLSLIHISEPTRPY